jgi:hypothetical protein
MYTLATTTFIAVDGGDGYTMFKSARMLIPPDRAQIDSDILQNEIMKAKTIAPRVDGRIQRVDKAARQKSNCD